MKKIIRKIKVRTWVSLTLIFILGPIAFLVVYSAEATPNPPSVYWNLDEGVDNTCSGGVNDACDSSGNGYDAANSGATWQTENMCIAGKCLLFDGTNDVVSLGSTVSNIRSISFWVKVFSTSTTQELIDLNGTDYVTSVSGTITVTGFGTDTIYVDGLAGATITANNWHHVEITTTSDFSGSAVKVGQISTNYGNFVIDDIKIYTYARSSGEVKTDAIRGSDQKGASAVFGANDTSYLNQGLVGYWKMDDGSIASHSCATGGTGNTCDASGNNNHGTDTGTMTDSDYVGGKYGSALDFDATDDYVTAPDSTSLEITGSQTITAWIKPRSFGEGGFGNIVTKNDTQDFRLYLRSSSSGMAYAAQGSSFVSSNSNIVTLNTWQHIALVNDSVSDTVTFYVNGIPQGSSAYVYAPTGSANPLIIGNDTLQARTFDGLIDEVRVYNRTLSPAEVQKLYNWAPGPSGYWPMDENTGQYVYDRSGSGNTGVLGSSSSVQSTDPTWEIGKFGAATGYNGQTSDRFVYIPSNTGNNFTNENLTVMAWVRRTGDASFSNPMYIVDKINFSAGYELKLAGISTTCNDAGNGGTSACFNVSDGTDTYYMSTTGDGITADSTWHHIAAVFDRNNENNNIIFIDGIAQATTINGTLANIGSLSSSSIPLCLGIQGTVGSCSNTNEFNGSIDEVKIYNYARTPQQIIEDMNAGHPTGGSPIGTATSYWKFDEAAGTTAYDANATSGNNLTLSTASWTASGKYNSAWNGNGTAYLSRADDPDFDVAATDNYSVSLWFKSDATSNPGSTEYLFNKANATTAGYAVYANTSGNLCFAIDDDATWSPDVASCSPGDIYDNTWHHLVAVRNVTADQTQLYIDGLLVDSDTDTTTATLENSLSLYIGDRDGTNNGDEFNGDLDEIKVFRDALSADEVKLLFNANSVTNFGTGIREADALADGAGNPPVGYWNFNENTGSTVYDKSGNNVNMTRYGNAAYVPGKVGSSMTFDGSETGNTTHASVQTDSYDSQTTGTLCSWVKPYDTGDAVQSFVSIAEDDDGSHTDWMYMGFQPSSNSIFFNLKDNNVTQLTVGAGTITPNEWSHFCITMASTGNSLYLNGAKVTSPTYSVGSASTDVWIDNIAENSTGLSIGCLDGNISIVGCSAITQMFEGQIDEVKLWDYALTPAQIAYDYNRGAPVAWYKLDECTGTTIYDAAKTANGTATGNNGTWSGASGTNTSAGTCSSGTGSEAWNNGTTGKLNASLDFDGTDDIVTISPSSPINNLTQVSVTAWIYPNSFGENSRARIIDKNQVLGGGWAFYIDSGIYCGGSNRFDFHHYWSSSTDALAVWCADSNTISTGKWQHVAVTYDVSSSSNDAVFYLNGKQVGTTEFHTPTGTTGDDSSINLTLGNKTALDRTFDGQIDDVRVYNYILSESQIKRIMQDGPVGSAARFGPETGSP